LNTLPTQLVPTLKYFTLMFYLLSNQTRKKMNEEKPADVYHFIMTDEEVTASKPTRETPPPSEHVKIVKVVS